MVTRQNFLIFYKGEQKWKFKKLQVHCTKFTKTRCCGDIVDHFDDVYHDGYDSKTKKALQLMPNLFKSNEEIFDIIARVAKKFGKDTDKDHFFSINLDDQTVFKASTTYISERSFYLYFKVPQNKFGFEDLIKFGAVSDDGVKKIQGLVEQNKSIMIAGNVGSGKTTLANIVSAEVPPHYKVVSIERHGDVL